MQRCQQADIFWSTTHPPPLTRYIFTGLRHVTVRGEKAIDLIERGLKITDYEISSKHFSASGALTSYPTLPCHVVVSWPMHSI